MAAPSRTAAFRLSRRLRPQRPQPSFPTSSSRPTPIAARQPICAPASAPCLRWHSNFSSVNPDEVSHFNALAGEWWDPHGSSRLLHLMNPLRHDFIRTCRNSAAQQEPDQDESLSYLDIGCGGGIFAESAARMPNTRRVTAIDPTPSVLAVAKAHARKDPSLSDKLTYTQTSIEELPVPASDAHRYDVVSLFEVIEHVDEPAAFLELVRPFVKPGGWLVMSTIARTWMSWLTTNLVAEDILRIVPKGTHDWNKYINEEELRRYFLDKGWESPRVMGVVYVPGLGWKEVRGSEKVGNYFFGVRRAVDADAS
ncbi:Hexaprenyldihydroxybenzoate methyltransferase, mitochondrial [Purpureocillium takamizusanense]|uniref:Ubiquinone biosynthesis O-methyltransferase, mitochondrial n=1 Tax=Purpureocillium takamizusanense TaxID=2060973 RepID=A0A9Q8QPU4_9HYPO|nr:Hexaprenyldihydroxybenzoate methyltransferase, mitochondrial [Purpureocillium takamizusanense]UNI22666.1 Hexaprenyldihydroxybenzoate methyltransferase, mitochondrial [Purpureocillium takamizusanense]